MGYFSNIRIAVFDVLFSSFFSDLINFVMRLTCFQVDGAVAMVDDSVSMETVWVTRDSDTVTSSESD